ncbi:hypothetical protein DN401_04075 [Bacillus sp. BF2-3]|nr:hypothetical protein DN401_04075 [Bacillus sp. BF2-3]
MYLFKLKIPYKNLSNQSFYKNFHNSKTKPTYFDQSKFKTRGFILSINQCLQHNFDQILF